ncbi:hypothetical protein ACFSUD_11075 [Sulfitobacter aestuarii]|uniref:Uncharacterized protein n=1 Tax=Sulfitobacter aestuarii TaxID=2161676 RepID=A0ABW5U467_9RHOB
MKMRFSFPEAQPGQTMSRGAAPVGQLQELPGLERAAILSLRAWCDGGAARAALAEDIAALLGRTGGEEAQEAFDALMRLILQGARRPMMRHGCSCSCIGGDENAFAQMIGAAAAQDREEAMLFAAILVSGGAAFELVERALSLGPLFLQLGRGKASRVAADRSGDPRRLH